MFQIKEDSMQRLMEASNHLHGALVASPLWEMLRTEPVVANWINALGEVESQIKQKEPENDQAWKNSSSESKTGTPNS